MSDTESINPEQLENFGLSRYESKVYISLLSGDKDAQKIVKQSEIPTGRIYDVLGSLRDKGLAKEGEGRPKKYSAVDPTLALKILLNKEEDKLDRLRKRANNIESKLIQLQQHKPPEEGVFWSVALFNDNKAIESHNEKILETKTELLN